MTVDDTSIDFASAEHFLCKAKIAHQAGNHAEFIAARKLVAVALRMDDEVNSVGVGPGGFNLPAKRSPPHGGAGSET